MNPEQIFDRINRIIKSHHLNQHGDRFLEYNDPETLRKILNLDDSPDGASWDQIFIWIEQYLAYSVKTNHKGFVNRMWEGANLPSILGEMITAISNTSSCTYESAPVSTLMEKYMINRMLDLVGFKNGEGQMTTGSSNANLIAMMAARNEKVPQVKSQGLREQSQLLAFVSEDAHYSMEKATNVLGIGTGNLIKIPVTPSGEMDLDILSDRLEQTVRSGGVPFFVAGTAGTTVRGAYDSIPGLLALRRKHGFWLHIDGAWGGAVLVSDTLKDKFMKGIESVDSLTWDFHKMLGTSLICNIFLINNKPRLLGRTVTSEDETYIFHGNNDNANEVRDLGSVSLQCGRRVDSLKWFLDWKYFGKAGFAQRVETALELCRHAESLIQSSENLEMVFPRNSFNICFRYKTKESMSNKLNLDLRDTLYHQGKSLVGYAYHKDRLFLRLLLANHDLTPQDIDIYFSTLIETAKKLEGEFHETDNRIPQNISAPSESMAV